jgi:hypothetical protein
VATGVEAEFVQAHLKGSDIVAAQHVAGAVLEQSLTDPPARLFQAAEGLWSNDTVHEQPAVLLKLPDGRSDGFVVDLTLRYGQ